MGGCFLTQQDIIVKVDFLIRFLPCKYFSSRFGIAVAPLMLGTGQSIASCDAVAGFFCGAKTSDGQQVPCNTLQILIPSGTESAEKAHKEPAGETPAR